MTAAVISSPNSDSADSLIFFSRMAEISWGVNILSPKATMTGFPLSSMAPILRLTSTIVL